MKKTPIILLAALVSVTSVSYSANLVEVYQQALVSDSIYQQAVFSRLSTDEGIPISFASLLPHLTAQLISSFSKQGISSAHATFEAGSISNRGYTLGLNLSQTVFDFRKIANLMGAYALSSQADAALSAATQDLMIRSANAYFTLLQDEDNLMYSKANKTWLNTFLDKIRQQYQVGLKTITDVYATQANHDIAIAQYITDENQVQIDRENLRVITGRLYSQINILSDKFPFFIPQPANVDTWVKKAEQQNWSIKVEQYRVISKLQNIRQQFAGYLPTLSLNAGYTNNYDYTAQTVFLSDTPAQFSGSTRTVAKSVDLTMNIPLFQGGSVPVEMQKAKYDYQMEQQMLEQVLRNTINVTRKSYLNVISSVNKIIADKQAVKSAQNALEGMGEGYRVGTKTIVDVLQQRQKFFDAQKTYAKDRYQYIINFLLLKQAIGTLSGQDLERINHWLRK